MKQILRLNFIHSWSWLTLHLQNNDMQTKNSQNRTFFSYENAGNCLCMNIKDNYHTTDEDTKQYFQIMEAHYYSIGTNNLRRIVTSLSRLCKSGDRWSSKQNKRKPIQILYMNKQNILQPQKCDKIKTISQCFLDSWSFVISHFAKVWLQKNSNNMYS